MDILGDDLMIGYVPAKKGIIYIIVVLGLPLLLVYGTLYP
jgi:hypothetical protein